jgi:hypothetical protein
MEMCKGLTSFCFFLQKRLFIRAKYHFTNGVICQNSGVDNDNFALVKDENGPPLEQQFWSGIQTHLSSDFHEMSVFLQNDIDIRTYVESESEEPNIPQKEKLIYSYGYILPPNLEKFFVFSIVTSSLCHTVGYYPLPNPSENEIKQFKKFQKIAEKMSECDRKYVYLQTENNFLDFQNMVDKRDEQNPILN